MRADVAFERWWRRGVEKERAAQRRAGRSIIYNLAMGAFFVLGSPVVVYINLFERDWFGVSMACVTFVAGVFLLQAARRTARHG